MKLTVAKTELVYESAHPDLEIKELCTNRFNEALTEAINSVGGEPHPEWKAMVSSTRAIPGGGVVLKEIKGAGTVYDWRDSPWTKPNGGLINLHAFVQHIPVIRNVDGVADFVTLRNVLVDQGLMVQTATDSEGNVALFTPFNYLCYQARGANQVSTGCEHMHYLASEDWSKRQLRAMAWLIQLCERKHDVPRTRGTLGPGTGVARVLEEGQVWHSEVSDAAGYHDRSDPWGNTLHDVVVARWEYVQFCIRYFEENGHFEGA